MDPLFAFDDGEFNVSSPSHPPPQNPALVEIAIYPRFKPLRNCQRIVTNGRAEPRTSDDDP
jgi:hypothetical protein